MGVVFYTLVALQALDAITTVMALRKPGVTESNRLLRWLMGRLGVMPTLLIAKGAFVLLLWLAAPLLPDALLWAIAVGYVWVVANNVRVLSRSREIKAR